MKLHNPTAEIFVPDGVSLEIALSRITHVGIGAHPDDVELIGLQGIGICREQRTRGFAAIVATDGGAARRREQEQAARLGDYGLLIQLGYDSAWVRGSGRLNLEEDLVEIARHLRPKTLYTHSLLDRHDTHLAVAVAAIRASQRSGWSQTLERAYGVEVWGSLDWLPENMRIALDVSEFCELSEDLLKVFRSQLEGGKRYDVATRARWVANATFADPYGPDRSRLLTWALDLLPIVRNPSGSIISFVRDLLRAHEQRVVTKLQKMLETGSKA